MEHIELIFSLESELTFLSICSIRNRSRKCDIVQKPPQLIYNSPKKIRPDVQRALADGEIQALLAELRSNPARGQQRLSNLKPASKANVEVLIRNGLLQFQR